MKGWVKLVDREALLTVHPKPSFPLQEKAQFLAIQGLRVVCSKALLHLSSALNNIVST